MPPTISEFTDQEYGRLFPSYWNGPTGRRIAEYGGIDALCLGVYLTANDRANPIGLYPLPFALIELPLDQQRLIAAFAALDRAGFATYDYGTSFVWVKEMARFRMGLNSRNEHLSARDSRVPYINRLYRSVRSTPFVWAFFQRYRKTFGLSAGYKPIVFLRKDPLSPPPAKNKNIEHRTVQDLN